MNKQSKALCLCLLIGLIATGCSGNNTSSLVSSSITSSNTSTSSGGGSTSSTTSSADPSVSHKNIAVHISSTDSVNVEFYFFNNNPDIPYLEISDSVNKLMNTTEYEISFANNTFTLKNRYNDSTFTLSTEGIVTFSDYAKFHATYENDDNCYIDEFSTTSITCKKIKAKSSYTAPKEYKVDLSKFGFKPVKNGNKYYLPINVFHSFIAPDTGTYYFANDGEIYLYGIKEEMKPIVTSKAKTSYSNLKAFFEYNFNLFSLNTEMYFGLKGFSRTLRYNNKVLNYLPDGVINAFASYKDKIINSKTIAEFDKNMTDMVSATMTDGGHTYCRFKSIANNPSEYLEDSEEDTYLHNLEDVGKAERKKRKDDGFNSYIYSFDTDEDGKYDIGYVTFDSFKIKDDEAKGELSVQSIFRGSDGANSTLNKNADGYDFKNYDIKDVVIDLSLNGGGNVSAEGYVLSWICGGIAQQTLKGTNGGGYSTFTYNFDVDGDGEYTSKDYLPDDVNVYLLISPCTYSAANALAFDTYLYNPNLTRKVKFIGQQSAGGACSVTELCYLPSGFSYRLAGNDASIYPNKQTVCCEDGVNPTSGFQITEFTNIFNRTGPGGINDLVKSPK